MEAFTKRRTYTVSALLGIISVLVTACGGSEAASTPTPNAGVSSGQTSPATPAGGGGSVSTAGWKTVTFADNNCQVQVPPNWTGNPEVDDPTFKAHAYLPPSFPAETFSDVTKAATQSYKIVQTLDNTSDHYLIEWKNPQASSGTNYYAAIPVAGGVCTAIFTINLDADIPTFGPIGKQILATLAAAK